MKKILLLCIVCYASPIFTMLKAPYFDGRQLVLNRLMQSPSKSECRCSHVAKEEYYLNFCRTNSDCLNRCLLAAEKLPKLRRKMRMEYSDWTILDLTNEITDIAGCKTNIEFINSMTQDESFFAPDFIEKTITYLKSSLEKYNLRKKREEFILQGKNK